MQPIIELPSGMPSPNFNRLVGLQKTPEKNVLDAQTQEKIFRIRVDGEEMTFDQLMIRLAEENRLQNIKNADSQSRSRNDNVFS